MSAGWNKLPIGQRAQDARHFCRFTGCDFKAEPQAGAHGIVRMHREQVHGTKSMTIVCYAECSYCARPAEGRYIKGVAQ